jgi:hypothetical protein
MHKLRIAVLAAALVFAGVPAVAVDLPDYGSKNFSPADDTPAYLANEGVPVTARTADTTERDWSDVDALVPERSSVGSARWGHRFGGRRARYAFNHGSHRHAAEAHSTNFSKALWVGHARGTPASARTMSARHGRPNAHHASAAATHPGA